MSVKFLFGTVYVINFSAHGVHLQRVSYTSNVFVAIFQSAKKTNAFCLDANSYTQCKKRPTAFLPGCHRPSGWHSPHR